MLEVLECLLRPESWSLAPESQDPPPCGPPAPPVKLSDDEKRRKTVLIVEDDQDVRNAVMDCLAEEHFSSVAVRNGVEAIYYLTNVRKLPDLILLDLMMPVMDGWTLKKKLEAHPEWNQIPVVIYSANTRVRPITAAVVLAKPISLSMLVDTIEAQIIKGKP